jgi:hypothetical protein
MSLGSRVAKVLAHSAGAEVSDHEALAADPSASKRAALLLSWASRHPAGGGHVALGSDELRNYAEPSANFSPSRLRKSRSITPPPAHCPDVCNPYTLMASETTGPLSSPKDDEGQRRPGLSDPRNAEVRPLPGRCRPTLGPAALPVAEQSSRAGP